MYGHWCGFIARRCTCKSLQAERGGPFCEIDSFCFLLVMIMVGNRAPPPISCWFLGPFPINLHPFAGHIAIMVTFVFWFCRVAILFVCFLLFCWFSRVFGVFRVFSLFFWLSSAELPFPPSGDSLQGSWQAYERQAHRFDVPKKGSQLDVYRLSRPKPTFWTFRFSHCGPF